MQNYLFMTRYFINSLENIVKLKALIIFKLGEI